MSTAFSAILDDVIRFPGLGIKTTVSTSTGAGTATSTDPELARYAQQTTFFEGKFLYIPSAAAAADQVRTIVSHSVSTATITFTLQQTANFGETLSSVTAYILPLHPDSYMEATNEGLERMKFTEPTPLAHGPASFDMQGANVDSDWTESVSTDAVQTTSSEVLHNAQSLVVTNAGYTESAAQRVGQGKAIQIHLLAKADIGTNELQVIDGSSNEQDDITFTEEQWVYGTKRVDFDSADETFTLRLAAIGTSDSGDWQAAWYVRQGEYRFELPSWITDRFVIKGLVSRRYYEPANDSGSSDELYLANSYEDFLLLEGQHYQVRKMPNAAHTRILEILDAGKPYMDRPMFLYVQHPWSAPWGVTTVYTTYTGTTNVPLDLIAAATLENLGKNHNWPDIEERGRLMLTRVYFEDEMEQVTMPKPEPWRGPAGGIVI